MIDCVEGLRDVHCNSPSADGRFLLVETVGCCSDDRKKSGSGRTEGSEAVLGARKRVKRGVNKG
jgi:hypothetical protein